MDGMAVGLAVGLWLAFGAMFTWIGVDELGRPKRARVWTGDERVLALMVLTGAVLAPVWLVATVLAGAWVLVRRTLRTASGAVAVLRGGGR